MNAVIPAREAMRASRLRTLRDVIDRARAGIPGAEAWHISYDRRLLRLERRLDALVATPKALLAVLFRPGLCGAAERRLAEDAALDVSDFLQGAASFPVVPVLLTSAAGPDRAPSLPLAGVGAVRTADPVTLPDLFHEVVTRFPLRAEPAVDWDAAAYRPVPALTEAACTLFNRHGASELLAARAPGDALNRTRAAIRRYVEEAQQRSQRTVVFVTGAPGAGKTLCGLDAAFAGRGAFLTGNPALVHVLREALVRDAAGRGMEPRAARQRMKAVIQELRDFRDHGLGAGAAPSDPVLVIDEAQRCWDEPTARLRSRERAVKLTDSEPGCLLDIAGRRPGVTVVCLLGGGQEIHDGEGGLREWGRALARRTGWRVAAPPDTGADPRQHFPAEAERDAALHLGTPLRSVNHDAAASWVDAVLRNDPAAARRLAPDAPFHLTRSLPAMRAFLRHRSRGLRRAGVVATAQGKRLRAEGPGATLPHMDEDAVARWFLDRAPDVRSAGALEVPATEFAVQGLELDVVGVCWDADLVRDRNAWQARLFRGAAWTTPRRPDALANRLNAYRVLLTRARHGTAVWVPRGDSADPTRPPALFDAVAAYLRECGIPELAPTPAQPEGAKERLLV